MFNKYHAIRCRVGNIKFDSKAEARRYLYLKSLENAKEITDLKMQVKFPFMYDNKKIFDYIADFVYFDYDGNKHVEDVKGCITPLFRLKKKLIEVQYKIKIEIVK